MGVELQALQVANFLGEPVLGSEVLIGGLAGGDLTSPIVIKADDWGELHPSDRGSQRRPVTIRSGQYVLTTYMGLGRSHQTLSVGGGWGEPVLIQGTVDGYSRMINGDQEIDFTIVYPSLTRRQLIDFDHTQIFSAQKDILISDLKIWDKEFHIPSNISVPLQKETYGPLTVELDKPSYRIFVTQPRRSLGLMAVRGRLALDRVVEGFKQGQSLFQLFNHFKFIGGIQSEVRLRVAGSGLLSEEHHILGDGWKFRERLRVHAPRYERGHSMVSFSFMENSQGEMFPMDIRPLESSQSRLLKFPESPNNKYMLSLLVKSSQLRRSYLKVEELLMKIPGGGEEGVPLFGKRVALGSRQVSLVIQPVRDASGEHRPVFLDLIEAPQVHSFHRVYCTPPRPVEGIFPVATQWTLYRVKSFPGEGLGAAAGGRGERIWEVFSPSWVSEVELPELSLDLESGQRYIWEVLYLGSDREILPGETWRVEDISHVTRSALGLELPDNFMFSD